MSSMVEKQSLKEKDQIYSYYGKQYCQNQCLDIIEKGTLRFNEEGLCYRDDLKMDN